jgi:hypothetical protein
VAVGGAGWWSKGTGLLRFARGVHGLLQRRIDDHTAAATIARGVAQREQRFLDVLDAKVWPHASSPYRALLDAAGCTRGDVARLVQRDGLGFALRVLADAGVRVGFDELKGRADTVRGSRTFRFRAEDFDDPLMRPDLALSSSGTRGPRRRVQIDVEHVAELAAPWAMFLSEHEAGHTDTPLLFWTPGHAGIAARYLACAVAGRRYERWFVSEVMNAAVDRAYAACVHGLSRRAGKFPAAERVPFDAPAAVLDALCALLARGARPCVNTAPTAASALALLACERGVALDGVTFLLGAEPLTDARRATITAAGARCAVLYGSSEAPWIGAQCAIPACADAVHVLLDGYAVITATDAGSSAQNAASSNGETRDGTLLLTSLRRAVPTVLINADIGDRARLDDGARCGCTYDRLGCVQQLSSVRSSDKITELGVTFAVRDVQHVLEDALPRRLGGVAGDYQLIEERDGAGLPRYIVRVHPRLDVDEARVADAFLAELSGRERHYGFMVATWQRAGIVCAIRAPALIAPSGKVPSFHRVPEPTR